MTKKTMVCGVCGGQMSLNPHPDSGKPPMYLEVGTKYVCIPCTVKSRHSWAQRATDAETKLISIRKETAIEIFKKIESDCPHRVMANFNGAKDISLRRQFECPECRQKLKQEYGIDG
jgi:hypothetical protein